MPQTVSTVLPVIGGPGGSGVGVASCPALYRFGGNCDCGGSVGNGAGDASGGGVINGCGGAADGVGDGAALVGCNGTNVNGEYASSDTGL